MAVDNGGTSKKLEMTLGYWSFSKQKLFKLGYDSLQPHIQTSVMNRILRICIGGRSHSRQVRVNTD